MTFGVGLTAAATDDVVVEPDVIDDGLVLATPELGSMPVVLSQPASTATAAAAVMTMVSPLWFIG